MLSANIIFGDYTKSQQININIEQFSIISPGKNDIVNISKLIYDHYYLLSTRDFFFVLTKYILMKFDFHMNEMVREFDIPKVIIHDYRFNNYADTSVFNYYYIITLNNIIGYKLYDVYCHQLRNLASGLLKVKI